MLTGHNMPLGVSRHSIPTSSLHPSVSKQPHALGQRFRWRHTPCFQQSPVCAAAGKKASDVISKPAQGSCYGCGAAFQIELPMGAGYVPPDKYEVKRKHRQLNKLLCERCSGLCNGAMIPAVQDFRQRLELAQAAEERAELLGKLLVSPEELRAQLLLVKDRKALVVLLVDLLDASGTMMSKVRDIVGKNPVVLVGTKMDMLPAGCRPKEVVDWLHEAADRKHLNVVSAHLVSSHTGAGVEAVTGKICRERKGRDVFVIGAANVGKSAFVRAMLREMSQFESVNFDAAAMSSGKYLPVESAMPGTTLGLIPLQAFESGGTLYDTPGVHLHHRVPHMLSPEEVKLLLPRKRLSPFIAPSPASISSPEGEEAGDDEASFLGRASEPEGLAPKAGRPPRKPVAASYIWTDLVRIDVVSAPPSTEVVFQGPNTMRVYGLPLLESEDAVSIDPNADDEQADGSSSSSSSSRKKVKYLSCAESVQSRGGQVAHSVIVKSQGNRMPLADIAVSGVPGWVTLYAPFAKTDLKIRVWVPRGVEVFIRPPLPCASPFKADADKDADLDDDDISTILERYGSLGMDDEESYADDMDGDEDGDEGFADLSEADLEALAALEEMDPDDLSGWGDVIPEGMVFEASVEEMLQGKATRRVMSGGRAAGARGRAAGAGAAGAARSEQLLQEEEEEESSDDEDDQEQQQASRSSKARSSRAAVAGDDGGGDDEPMDLDSPNFSWDGIKITLSDGSDPKYLAGLQDEGDGDAGAAQQQSSERSTSSNRVSKRSSSSSTVGKRRLKLGGR